MNYQRDRRREKLDRENPNRRRWSRTFVRDEYFATVSRPVQAYVAGLLAADGNVLGRLQRITLELSYKDRELVSLVRDELAPDFPIRERIRANGCHTAILSITSRQLCTDLGRLGVTPRKSLTLRWPRHLEESQARPFLLGYFDGDGYITWSRTGVYLYPRWGLIGTRAFLEAAMNVIVAETDTRARKVHKQAGRQIHTLGITGRDAWTVDEWLHTDGTLGLARKRLGGHSQGTLPA